MFMRILTSALFAGVGAGLIAAVLQLYFIQPTLLHAELYETAQLVHFGNEPAASATSEAQSHNGHHSDGAGEGFERNALTVLFTVFVYSGYGFILAAIMAVAHGNGLQITTRQGLLWGVAGYIAVQFAPAFGLPPEVPGVSAADVYERQIWWFVTAVASALALWLIAFSSQWLTWLAAIVLLLAPHIVGAPHPDGFAGLVPPELAATFASRALGVGLMAWAVLGVGVAYFWQRTETT